MAASARPPGVLRRLTTALRGAGRRVYADVFPLLQTALAAALAWLIAKQIAGHPDPFFAPIAVVLALNTARGERGVQALRMLQGVAVGIFAGELVLWQLGTGYWELGLAVLLAGTIARALGGPRLVLGQSAISAILILTFADAATGWERMADAAIGAGVALVFTQVLFTPNPVALVRRAATAALIGLAGGLRKIADAIEQVDHELAVEALDDLRDLRDRLSDLHRATRSSHQLVRGALFWRTQRDPVVQEEENAGHLDLLAGSCLMLGRAVASSPAGLHRELAPVLRGLAEAVEELAAHPGDREARQRAADRALDLARMTAAPPGSLLDADPTVGALRMVATDVMVYAGVDQRVAAASVLEGTGELRVVALPPAPRHPLDPLLRER